jgi:hypothetical protein
MKEAGWLSDLELPRGAVLSSTPSSMAPLVLKPSGFSTAYLIPSVVALYYF